MLPTLTRPDSFYQCGGDLPSKSPSYIARRHDKDLYDGLIGGEFCYVLTSRQMGKSSLARRIKQRLRSEGVTVAWLDLAGVGGPGVRDAEQWFGTLLMYLGQELDLEDDLDDFWKKHRDLSPLYRWREAIRQVVLVQRSGPVVVFIDEIENVRNLGFSTDEFFASIRACYNHRADDPELRRLTFCLVGTATPSELIDDPLTTPFNIGRRIELEDFTQEEAAGLAKGLKRDEPTANRLMERIYFWTGGQPYLTQKLCDKVATGTPEVVDIDGVDRLCEEMFFTKRGPESDDKHLPNVGKYLLPDDESQRAALLDLYAKVRRGQQVRDDETSDLFGTLRLSGLVRVDRGHLRVRNRIYDRVFDRPWVRDNMPDAEARRQRAAFSRAARRVGLIAACVVVGMLSLALWALYEKSQAQQNADKAKEAERIADEQRNIAEEQKRNADDRRRQAVNNWETARRNLYVAQMNLAQRAGWQRDIRRAIELLDEQTSGPGQDALCGFEWYYLWQLYNGSALTYQAAGRSLDARRDYPWQLFNDPAQTVRGHNDTVRSVAFSPDGRILATGSEDNSVKLWDMSRPGIRLFDAQRPAFPFPQQVNSLAFASDGKTLATGHNDGIVRLLDPTTGRVRATLGRKSSGHDVMSVAFSPPDGKVLASGSMDDTVKLWDAASGQEIRILDLGRGIIGIELKHEDGQVVVESLVPDGAAARDGRLKPGDRIVRVSGPDGSLAKTEGMTVSDARKWIVGTPGSQVRLEVVSGNAPQPKVVELTFKKTPKENKGVRSVAFSPDGKTLAVGNRDQTVTLWDVATGRRQAPLLGADHSEGVNAVAISPDGKTLASGSDDNTIKLWNLPTRRERPPPLSGHANAVMNLTFSPDGKTLASGSLDSTVRLWDVATAPEQSTPLGRTHRALGHTHRVYSVAFSPDGSKVVAGGGHNGDGTIRLWDLSVKAEQATTTDRHARRVNAITFSPDGTTMATVSHDKTAKLWDVATGRVRATFAGHTDSILAVKFVLGGKTLLTGSSDMTVKWWDASAAASLGNHSQEREQATVALEGKGHTATINAMAFSPDGTMLASASDDKTVTLWDVASGKQRRTLSGPLQVLLGKGHTGPVLSIAFAPDGRTLASGSSDNMARLWDPATWRSRAILAHGHAVSAVAVSPDGKTLATGSSQEQDVKLWDPATQKVLADLTGHQSDIRFLTFSQDGQRLASGDQAGTVKIWDVPSRQELLTLPLRPGSGPGRRTEGASLSAMAFAPDGKTFVTASDDGSVRWWRGASDTDVNRDYFERLKLNRRAWDYARVIEQNPANAEVWSWLGRVSAEQGKWAKAVNEFDMALKKGEEDKYIRYFHAVLCLETGDMRGYRDTCAALLERFGPDADPRTANRVAWWCALGPEAVPDLSRPRRLVKKAVAESPGKPQYVNTLGAVLYRAGDYEEAIRTLNESINAHGQGGSAWDWLFLAMAHQRAGRPEEAKSWYDRAARWIEQEKQGKAYEPYQAQDLPAWSQKLEWGILRREAEALLRAPGR